VVGEAASPSPPPRSTGIYVKIVMNQPARKEVREKVASPFSLTFLPDGWLFHN